MLTPRENALNAYRHIVPERIVNLIKDSNNIATYALRERARAVPGRPFGSDGVDWFGVHWKYEEACGEFFDRVADHKIELIDRLAEVYPIDLIDFHDDYGTQISTFMSVETWNELLAGPIGRIFRHCKEKGILIQLHSCGKVETLLPSFIAAGVEHWSSCQGMNDIKKLVHEYGDKMTFFGCMDTPEVQRRGITPEKVYALTKERIEDICRGGVVFPLGNSTVPGLGPAVQKILAEKADFFKKAEKRVLP